METIGQEERKGEQFRESFLAVFLIDRLQRKAEKQPTVDLTRFPSVRRDSVRPFVSNCRYVQHHVDAEHSRWEKEPIVSMSLEKLVGGLPDAAAGTDRAPG